MDEFQNTIEIWKAVPGWEGLYEVSNFGRVKSIGVSPWRKTGGILCTRANRGGYHYVCLSKDGVVKTLVVHFLVCSAFHGPRPINNQANHIDGVKTNNHEDNLEWVTPSGNILHACKLGLINPQLLHKHGHAGEHNSRARLREEDVIAIRAFPRGTRTQMIADAYGVKVVTIQKIRCGRLWKHIPLLLGTASTIGSPAE